MKNNRQLILQWQLVDIFKGTHTPRFGKVMETVSLEEIMVSFPGSIYGVEAVDPYKIEPLLDYQQGSFLTLKN